MANYGAKVSKPGYDVKTCSDKNLIYSSKFANAFKIAKEGATTKTIAASSTGTKTIAHGLSYAPSHLVYMDKVATLAGGVKWGIEGGLSSLFFDLDVAKDSGTWESDYADFSCYTDSTNLYVEIINGYLAQKTFNIYYFIFIEDNN
jgi:hypothetical protein